MRSGCREAKTPFYPFKIHSPWWPPTLQPKVEEHAHLIIFYSHNNLPSHLTKRLVLVEGAIGPHFKSLVCFWVDRRDVHGVLGRFARPLLQRLASTLEEREEIHRVCRHRHHAAIVLGPPKHREHHTNAHHHHPCSYNNHHHHHSHPLQSHQFLRCLKLNQTSISWSSTVMLLLGRERERDP